jgi:hypothetical protein
MSWLVMASLSVERRFMASYRVVLQCEGLSVDAGVGAAKDIATAFLRRNWHRRAVSNWDGKFLTLSVENDFDRDGRATLDEFSDEISACVKGGFDGDIRVVSVTEDMATP